MNVKYWHVRGKAYIINIYNMHKYKDQQLISSVTPKPILIVSNSFLDQSQPLILEQNISP